MIHRGSAIKAQIYDMEKTPLVLLQAITIAISVVIFTFKIKNRFSHISWETCNT